MLERFNIHKGTNMLILTRNIGEAVVINENIKILVVAAFKSGQVKLGFDAPEHVPILRAELLQKTPKNEEGTK